MTKKQQAYLDTVHVSFVIKMMRSKRLLTLSGELEPWLDWQIRCRREARQFIVSATVPFVSRLQVRKQMAWAGHVARACHSYAHSTLMFRPLKWWRLVQNTHTGSRADARHPRRWRSWRFEDAISHDGSWIANAINRKI